MDSLLPLKQTAFLIFFNLCMLFMMQTLMKKALRPPYVVSTFNRAFTVLLMYIFVLFSFWGNDWFHYKEAYQILLYDGYANMEDVYYWIAQNLSIDYISFRLIIWGGSLILFFQIIRKLPIKKDLALLLFCSIWIIWFSYARVSLAMVMLYWGVVLLYSSNKSKWLSYIIGLFIIGSSLFFHKSAAFGVALTLVALISLKIDLKYFIILSILAIPLLLVSVKFYIGEFLLMDVTDETIMEDIAVGQRYFDADSRNMGLGELLGRFLEFAPYYLIFFLILGLIKNERNINVPASIIFFARYQLLGVLISSVFFFNLGFGDTTTIAVRFLRFLAIPSTILLAYFWEHKYAFKTLKYTYYLGLSGLLYSVTYSLYCSMSS